MPTSAQEFREAAARKRKTVDVEIEGVGSVRLRALSAGDAQRFQAEVKKAQDENRDPEELSFAFIARSWVDGNNNPLLPEDEGIDLAKALDPDTYKVVVREIVKLNGVGDDAIREAEKNSAEPGAGSTPTGSQASSDTPTSI